MGNPMVECIPNFSEARRPEVVDAILAAIESVDGITILDRHSDIDHNRTVVTFVGAPEAVEDAAYRSIAKAAELINLDEHQGEHPRIGATDVVPFVPIANVSMQACVEMAQRLGQRVAETLNIPIYFYEEAATRPDRVGLENIRRGQYEALKEEIATLPDRAPDCGPARLTGAGATVIGARAPLIAFNVYLTTDDVSIASKIARSVRFSSGGLRFVKAMGVIVEGRAQVSMNLTNYRRTPLFRVVELIRREAQRYGVQIHHAELVGLIPNDALIDSAVWYMQLDQFKPEQVLESRLFAMTSAASAEVSPNVAYNFLDALASDDPTPGGGSASAYAAAMAAALTAMVGKVTVGKKKYASVTEEVNQLIATADELKDALRAAVKEDGEAFEAFIAARRLPRSTQAEQAARDLAIQSATVEAARVPLRVAQQALQVMQVALRAAEIGNLNAISDAGSAMNLAYAAVQGAGLNVRINIQSLSEPEVGAPLVAAQRRVEVEASQLLTRLNAVLQSRGGFDLE